MREARIEPSVNRMRIIGWVALCALVVGCSGQVDDGGPELDPWRCTLEVDGAEFVALPDLELELPQVHFQRTRNYASTVPSVVVTEGVATYQFPEGLAVYDVDARSFEVADKRGACEYE